jgi:hypothetical protein
MLGDREVPISTRSSDGATLHFTASNVPPGSHLARLRVDGVDSRIIASPKPGDPPTAVPIFDQTRVIEVQA